MSVRQRTAEERAILNARQNAVRNAWRREQTLVMTGHGTRNWTREEQKTLIEHGSIPGYQGHHMFSVKENGMEAGNSQNIQWLTAKEHLDAHGGDWKNQTIGYYDPNTGLTNEDVNVMYESAYLELTEPMFEVLDLDDLSASINQLEAEGVQIEDESFLFEMMDDGM